MTLRKAGLWVVWAEVMPSAYDASDERWFIDSITRITGGVWGVWVNASPYYGNYAVDQPSGPGWVRIQSESDPEDPGMLAHYCGVVFGAVEGNGTPDDSYPNYGDVPGVNVIIEDFE